MEERKTESLWNGETIPGQQGTRRVGSVTFGLMLILYGSLFLIHVVAPALHYETIFHLWPVVFILLGIEILVENRRSNTKECKFIYDFPAIIMLGGMLLFAMVMAVVDHAMHNPDLYLWW